MQWLMPKLSFSTVFMNLMWTSHDGNSQILSMDNQVVLSKFVGRRDVYGFSNQEYLFGIEMSKKLMFNI